LQNSDDLGRADLVTPVVNYLKASFNHWFESSASTVPAYETGWGGVINKAGATNGWVDFGNGYYNDHHFHYGYFLTVAAVIAKFDGAWLNQHREYINWFARYVYHVPSFQLLVFTNIVAFSFISDIINPSPQDPYFPVARCRDWFAGHSWASGIANGGGSRDQESSTEAISGYYGALLWASVALPQDYVNYAKLLIATEQQASQVYWHLYPQQPQTDRDNPYPEPEARKLVTMGNVMDWQSGAWLFWGAQKVQIAAIQILPLIPVNEVSHYP
jgi:endo-1,3(4)-beta-glucanase